MRTVLLASVVVGLVVTTTSEAPSGEKEDVLLAEEMIAEIKLSEEAYKRASDRAFKAITGTSEGKKKLSYCSEKDSSYWPICIGGKWDYEPVYKALRKRFYEEELRKLREP